MKKYITPAVEVQTVALCNNIMAVSFTINVSDTKETTDQLSRNNDWNIWDENEEEF